VAHFISLFTLSISLRCWQSRLQNLFSPRTALFRFLPSLCCMLTTTGRSWYLIVQVAYRRKETSTDRRTDRLGMRMGPRGVLCSRYSVKGAPQIHGRRRTIEVENSWYACAGEWFPTGRVPRRNSCVTVASAAVRNLTSVGQNLDRLRVNTSKHRVLTSRHVLQLLLLGASQWAVSSRSRARWNSRAVVTVCCVCWVMAGDTCVHVLRVAPFRQ
jgi:hypothetical protein